MNIEFQRVWTMPNSETFDMAPIYNFVWKYLQKSKVSIDPFARNKRWATYTNDLNPKTSAEYHMDAEIFLNKIKENGVKADLIIFDPPYLPRQISECYKELGINCGMKETQNSALYSRVKSAMIELLDNNATVLSFGWNSSGMGKKFGFDIVEILLCCHGGAHNDTICMAEKRTSQDLFNL